MGERKGTKALELWCKRLVKDCPEVKIENMTTSWRDGLAFCALVHHFRPDLIDMSTLKPENIYENNKLAFSIAEKHLGIPALLDPEDMVDNLTPDRLSILTYLSQFYQRLGHTVSSKSPDHETKQPSQSTCETTPFNFGKVNHDKCVTCGLPVYLAQRLIVAQKLYHRRCFRCLKCCSQLNPKSYQIINGSDFVCDSCQNEKQMSTLLNNNDQMGMLAFSDVAENSEPNNQNQKIRPLSITDKINMFERNKDNPKNNFEKKSDVLETKLTPEKHNLKENLVSNIDNTQVNLNELTLEESMSQETKNNDAQNINSMFKTTPKIEYKSCIEKYDFLQTQLSSDIVDSNDKCETIQSPENIEVDKKIVNSLQKEGIQNEEEDSNMTDDVRLSQTSRNEPNISIVKETMQASDDKTEISVPPRRKKHTPPKDKSNDCLPKNEDETKYPKSLNPFSDDEEDDTPLEPVKKISSNPFGSSDEEDDDVPPIQPAPKVPTIPTSTPTKRLIAVNPFWSDGEEPSSDEEKSDKSSRMYSSMNTSTPNLRSTPRRKKGKAPPPPSIVVSETRQMEAATSMDDVASISSISSFNSTVQSDQKSMGKLTPHLKKRPAPSTPLDNVSMASGAGGSMERGVDSSGLRNTSDGGRRCKGPAPGLPLPERREVKLQISPEELQVQLDLLETQQQGIERQGVLIEQMIRDKCEGDEACTAPQEEVEDLVIQLCELVNEKNDLFRKQTELMYIRRQQRLEQEQADIEHEIRVIQSRPAVNRIDADKVREEQLVARLVEIVRSRDELVQQIDAERQRERQEDLAIATSIANKRAQRNSDSNSSSIKSQNVGASPKKNKVKEKMKKQLRKAKHTLHISKKKDDLKEDKCEKDKK